MKAGKTKEQLIEELIYPMSTLRRRKRGKSVNEIKETLMRNNKILESNTQSLFNNPKRELNNISWEMLVLFSEQVYRHSRDVIENINHENFNPKNYFTDVELRKAKQYNGKIIQESDISLPLILDNTLKIDYDKFIAIVPVKTLASMSSLLLNYNFNIQREAKKRIVGNETIREATLVMDNVLEIKEHLKKGTLETTTIVINASAGTSDEGNELSYNEETRQLVVNEGTILDIVDGYHRCKASELAINENPDIDFNFIVQILNYTDDQAMKYQGQLAKATPISKIRQKQLSSSRFADIIVKNLSSKSELKGRVSDFSIPSLKNKEIVTYNVLSDSINDEFTLERMVDVHLVEKYLREYFDLLLGYYEEEFLINPLETRKHSLIVENNMFVGYVCLARRMYEENIDVVKVLDIVGSIDFNINNQLWKDIGVLNEKEKLNRTDIVRKNIREYFNNIKI